MPKRTRRFEQRAGRAFLVAALLFQQPATTAVIVVDSSCSLADAIESANADSSVGACTAGSGADEIRLTENVSLTSALPTVVSDLTLVGDGFAIRRDLSAPDFRILSVVGQQFTLRNTTISRGVAERGGGLHAESYAEVVIENSTLTDNLATLWGGALYIGDHSRLNLVGSTISDNDGGARGGGVYATDFSIVEIRDSLIAGNRASRGGALYNGWDSYSSLVGSTLTLNSASNGGAISNGDYGTLVLRNSTVSRNEATSFAGGIYNAFGYSWITLVNSTVAFNVNSNLYAGFESGTVNLQGAIVAYPIGGSNCDGMSYWFDAGPSSFDDDGSCASASFITAGVDFDLDLRNNGGPTATHALLDGSVAVDTGGLCGVANDQRGFARDDGACDAGAYEFDAEPIGGSVDGIRLQEVRCQNLRTGQSVVASSLTRESWDCEALGLDVSVGDRIRQTMRGRVVEGAAGQTLGVKTSSLRCRNRTAGGSVARQFQGISWDCEAEGLEVSTDDRLEITVTGTLSESGSS